VSDVVGVIMVMRVNSVVSVVLVGVMRVVGGLCRPQGLVRVTRVIRMFRSCG
jgi:hypothetical protein